MISLIHIKPSEIELKYTDVEYPLVYEYIGPNRWHGNMYYELNWYEIHYNYSVVGLICMGTNKYLKNSLHISVYEIFEKGRGVGTKVMDYIFDYAKSLKYNYITLQVRDDRAKIFYMRSGFVKRNIENIPLMIKHLEVY